MLAQSNKPLNTVPSVDLKRYAGTWYEIARYPNRFQRNCDSDTTATYSLRADGKVIVINVCRKKDGSLATAKGTAKVADPSNAKLRVSFFWPFYGNYWIIDLGKDYNYAVVGEPSRKYLWILSRTPQMDPILYQQVLSSVTAAGYDTSRIVKTAQKSS